MSKGLIAELTEAVKQDMELWKIQGPDTDFKRGFDTAVHKYAVLLGLSNDDMYKTKVEED